VKVLIVPVASPSTAYDALGIVRGGVGNKVKELCFRPRLLDVSLSLEIEGIIGGSSGTGFRLIDLNRLGAIKAFVSANGSTSVVDVELVGTVGFSTSPDSEGDFCLRRTTYQPIRKAATNKKPTMIPAMAPPGRDVS
jgi:hypothetical protein